MHSFMSLSKNSQINFMHMFMHSHCTYTLVSSKKMLTSNKKISYSFFFKKKQSYLLKKIKDHS